MFISGDISNSKIQALAKQYKVMNKNIDRLEKNAGRPMPRMRYIKLYYEYNNTLYFPHGAMEHIDVVYDAPKPIEDGEFQYKQIQNIPAEMKAQIGEQETILAEILLDDRRCGLIEMKTARGKSHLIMKLISNLQEKTLIVCHNLKTLKEMKNKCKEFAGYEIGERHGSKKKLKDISVTTHASFSKSPELFREKFGVLIIDECDTGFSDKMVRAISTSGVSSLFGLSGTPYRQDLSTEDLTLVYGKHIKVKGQDNNGYSILPDVVRIMYPSDVSTFESFHDIQDQLMFDTERLEQQSKYIHRIFGGDRPLGMLGLLLVSRVKECSLYEDYLRAKGLDTCIINGDTKIEDDEVAIKNMIEKKGVIIATHQKMSRGVDISEIDHIFLFYPNRFEGSVVQAVGRGLRLHPEKERVILHDWIDAPLLIGQSNARKSTYKTEYPGVRISTMKIEKKQEDEKGAI